MKTIIIDTNFLMVPSEFNVDIFEEFKRIMTGDYQCAIIDKTQDELLRLAGTGKTKQKLAAKVAIKLIGVYNLEVIPTKQDKHVDLLLLEHIDSSNGEFLVATQDADLKKALKSRKIPRIVVRKQQYLEIIE